MRRSNLGDLYLRCSVVGLFVTLLSGCGQAVTAPEAFNAYTSVNRTYECELPTDWSTSGGGKVGPEWVTASQGSAEINISADLTGSLMADLAESTQRLSGGPDPDAPELDPVAEIHDMGQEAISETLNSYQEIGDAQVLSCRLGPARKSEFTAAGSFGGKLHGYRVTVLGRDKRVVVICKSAEADWATIQPAFDRVIASLRAGQR